MIEFGIESTINRPIEDVFERLIDIDSYPEWLPKSNIFISCRKVSKGPVGAGTEFVDETHFGTFQGVVEEFERPTRVTFTNQLYWLGLKVLESRPGYILEATDAGTKVRHIAEAELYGLFRLLKPLIARMAMKERSRTVEQLKKSLEST